MPTEEFSSVHINLRPVSSYLARKFRERYTGFILFSVGVTALLRMLNLGGHL